MVESATGGKVYTPEVYMRCINCNKTIPRNDRKVPIGMTVKEWALTIECTRCEQKMGFRIINNLYSIFHIHREIIATNWNHCYINIFDTLHFRYIISISRMVNAHILI